jgi:glycosyltransferase involved in cell wall biosynthesis
MSYVSLGAALERLGHSVEIVAPGDFASLRGVGGRWVPLVYPFTIGSWIARHRGEFDVVMYHSYAGWVATACRRGASNRSVVMFHGVEPLYHGELRTEAIVEGHPLSRRYRALQEWLMPFMLRTACRTADLVTCLNRTEADFLRARRWTPAAGVQTVAHGVPEEFFVAARDDRRLQTLLFVGQWLPMKGIRYLQDAAVTLLNEDSSIRLVCAGTLAPEADVLSGFPPGLHRQLTVRPRVNQTELAALYRDADAFVFPSLYEAFSRAIVEAMASRLPIVTTKVGVAADALRHEDNAIIVPKRSAEAIVSAVRRLQNDPRLATRLANAAAAGAGNYRMDIVEGRTLALILDAAGAA